MWTAREPWLATVRHGCAGRRQHSDAEGRPPKSSLLVGGPGRLHGVIHWQSSSRRERRAQRPRPAEAADLHQYPHVGDTCSPFVGTPLGISGRRTWTSNFSPYRGGQVRQVSSTG